jgi:predicted AAA+ superfamily ATPase
VFGRSAEARTILQLIATNPVVAILGPRQVGKTTLARAIAQRWTGPTSTFDLEDPRDLERLDDPTTALRPLRGLVVIDEIQRRPDLFPVLRVLADRAPRPARFLVLGSASPGLLKQSSESLAGRIAYFELQGFGLADVGQRWDRLWLRGGFPRSYLARGDDESLRWRRELIRTFVERDLPALAITIPARTIHRFWMMLAHYHGQVWNGAELASPKRP